MSDDHVSTVGGRIAALEAEKRALQEQLSERDEDMSNLHAGMHTYSLMVTGLEAKVVELTEQRDKLHKMAGRLDLRLLEEIGVGSRLMQAGDDLIEVATAGAQSWEDIGVPMCRVTEARDKIKAWEAAKPQSDWCLACVGDPGAEHTCGKEKQDV